MYAQLIDKRRRIEFILERLIGPEDDYKVFGFAADLYAFFVTQVPGRTWTDTRTVSRYASWLHTVGLQGCVKSYSEAVITLLGRKQKQEGVE